MSNAKAVNPYAAPAARVEDIPANAEAEAIRKAHISHEASVKAVGFLYYLGAVGITLSGVAALVSGGESGMVALLLVPLGVGMFFAGHAVRALKSWGRIVGCILSVLGLFNFPIGTLINAYILYLFLSKKGRMVFSAEYQDIIAATPDVKYRTSMFVWIFLGILVALFAAALIAPMFGK